MTRGGIGRWIAAIRSAKNRIRTRAVPWIDRRLSGLALLLAFLLVPGYRLFDVESSVYDLQTKVRYLRHQFEPVPDSLALFVVLVDDESLRRDRTGRLRDPSPISRYYLAELLEAVAGARPHAVGLAFLLDRPSNEAEGDLRLHRALDSLASAGAAVVLPSRLVVRNGLEYPILPVTEILSSEVRPEGRRLVGHVNLDVSSVDGITRKVTPMVRLGGRDPTRLVERRGDDLAYYELGPDGLSSPAFATQLVRAARSRRSNRPAASEPSPELGSVHLDFTLPDASVRELSSATVLTGDADALLRGRVVIIGAGYSETGDRHAVPLSENTLGLRGGRVMGPVAPEFAGARLHAYAYFAVQAIVDGTRRVNVIDQAAPIAIALLTFPVFLIATLATDTRRLLVRSALILLLAFWMGATVLFQGFRVYVPIVRASAIFLILALLARMALTDEAAAETNARR